MTSVATSPEISQSLPVSGDSQVSYETFAPKTSAQRSQIARIEAWANQQTSQQQQYHSSYNTGPLFYKATTPSHTWMNLDPLKSLKHSETHVALSCAQLYTQRLTELLTQTTDVTATLKTILTQHIPDLTTKHDDLIHRSAEAISTAQRLEMDAAALFLHAQEIAMPLKRYDAVDAWSSVLGIVFAPNHGTPHPKNAQKQLATVQKRMTCRLKLDPVDDLVRSLDELDEAIMYFDSCISSRSNNNINSSSFTSVDEYSKRAKILRDEILDLVRESVVDRITQTSNDVKTTLGLITTYSSSSQQRAVTQQASSSTHPTSSSHMGLSSTTSQHTFSSIHAVGGVVPGDVLEASLIYTRFHGISSRIYGLLRIIYQHMTVPATSITIQPTYKVLWDTCRTTYFSSRELLLRCSIRSHLELLKNKHGLIGMTRLASVFIHRLCTIETALYLDFFGDRNFATNSSNYKAEEEDSDSATDTRQPTPSLAPPSHKAHVPTLSLELSSYCNSSSSSSSQSSLPSATTVHGGSNPICDAWFQSFMDSLCGHFHSTIRRGIVSLLDLDTLCQIIIILREEKNSIPASSLIVLSPAYKVMGTILEDVQERLIFCATSMVQREVIKFRPSPIDLDYPAKLIALQGEEEVEGSKKSTHPNQVYELWFPPLKSSLRVLSKIFGVVENKVFEDMALTCVRACTKSLKDASIYLKQKNGSGGILHSDLFLIQHLLILREQLSPFDIHLQSVERQLDFSDAGKAVSKFWSNTKTSRKMLFAMSTENALLTLLKEGVSVKESPMDSKRDLEDALRSSCNDFIEHASMVLIGPILNILEQYKSWSLTQEATSVRGSAVNNATASSSSTTELVSSSLVSSPLPPHLQASVVMDALTRTVDRFEPQHGEVLRQMSLYMENVSTQLILFKPVIRKVQRSLEEIRRLFLNSVDESLGWNEKLSRDAMEQLVHIERMVKKSSLTTTVGTEQST